ncbi:MAG: dihydropteroate synthase [Syntrophales bacterium]|jgi:dihydropteroate synthase|nr:dihydropteroate synthase [Syntrophales bacterium]
MWFLRDLQIDSPSAALAVLDKIKVDACGIEAMLPKMRHLNIRMERVSCRAANIIKQEMLAVGGDAAVARGTVACSIPATDVILMGTQKQLRRFAEKITRQPFGLSLLALSVARFLENIDKQSHVLKTARRDITLGERTLIMGIVNVTPDSFSDGGRYLATDQAIAHALRLVDDGADILDFGGESSRPGALPVSPEEELARIVPVIEAVAMQVDTPLSIDTTKAAVARAALDAGAEIVNDISSMSFDEQMPAVVAGTGAAVVLMHMRRTPMDMQTGDLTYASLWGEILCFLEERIVVAQKEGIEERQIVVDPGLGFGKSAKDNFKILRDLHECRVLGVPVLVGPSRKAFIGRLTGGAPEERVEGTAAAVTAAILNGAHLVRVHDVGAMKKVAAVADAINGKG